MGPRRTLTVALLIVGSLVAPVGSASGSAQEGAPHPSAKEWVLVDSRDGSILASRQANRPAAIASTTKLMTAYLTRKRLPLGRTLTAPPYHPLLGESLMGLVAGEQVSVRNLLYGLLLPSGNDAAVALADGVSGSISDFVAEMNREAQRLDLRHTHYANPIGLDDPQNYSTPRDLAHLAIDVRRDRILRRIVGTVQADVPGAHPEHLVNHNELLGKVDWMNGVKTGYTVQAGYVLIGSGTRKATTLVSVLMGAPTETARDDGTLALLKYGFSLYHRQTAIRNGERLVDVSAGGADSTVPALASQGLDVTVRADQRVRVDHELRRHLQAPVHRGQRVGSAAVLVDGDPVGEVDLQAARALRPAPAESLIDRVDGAVPGPLWVIFAVLATALAIATLILARVLYLRARAKH